MEGITNTYPSSVSPRIVQENENKADPKGSKHGKQTKDQSHHHGRWDEIPESLHAEETWICISLHGLEYIVLGGIKNLGIVTALLFD